MTRSLLFLLKVKFYAYYHCFDGCKCRFSAEKVNTALSNELSRYIPRDEYLDLYKQVITEAWNNQSGESNDELRQVKGQIKELEHKIAHIRDLLASNRLNLLDYKEMKAECQSKIEKLESRSELSLRYWHRQSIKVKCGL